jgi:DNA-directed RNA polymerase subunit beta'
MAVHVPLSLEAQLEARADDVDQQHPQPRERQADHRSSQDMVLGIYYLSMDRAGERAKA